MCAARSIPTGTPHSCTTPPHPPPRSHVHLPTRTQQTCSDSMANKSSPPGDPRPPSSPSRFTAARTCPGSTNCLPDFLSIFTAFASSLVTTTRHVPRHLAAAAVTAAGVGRQTRPVRRFLTIHGMFMPHTPSKSPNRSCAWVHTYYQILAWPVFVGTAGLSMVKDLSPLKVSQIPMHS